MFTFNVYVNWFNVSGTFACEMRRWQVNKVWCGVMTKYMCEGCDVCSTRDLDGFITSPYPGIIHAYLWYRFRIRSELWCNYWSLRSCWKHLSQLLWFLHQSCKKKLGLAWLLGKKTGLVTRLCEQVMLQFLHLFSYWFPFCWVSNSLLTSYWKNVRRKSRKLLMKMNRKGPMWLNYVHWTWTYQQSTFLAKFLGTLLVHRTQTKVTKKVSK